MSAVKVLCGSCKNTVYVTLNSFSERDVVGNADKVSEHGIVCPQCQTFTRACYDSPVLKEMRTVLNAEKNHNRQRTQAQAYRTAFHALQSKMARKDKSADIPREDKTP